jgi:S-adenosylmethionine-diacylglycerol 3-amino-3-carboxypropyl transferase
LKAENFDTLKSRVDRIATHSMTLSHFLEHNPGKYSHFILLDHQDWLAANNYPALEHEWKLIFENARPGTKILLRSAAPDASFLPKWVPEKLDFDLEAAQWSHINDRVGTYASTHIATVR